MVKNRIKAHDPTVDGSSKPNNDLISFKRLGVKEISSNTTSVGPVVTLKVNLRLLPTLLMSLQKMSNYIYIPTQKIFTIK